jgi:hypothetical protein
MVFSQFQMRPNTRKSACERTAALEESTAITMRFQALGGFGGGVIEIPLPAMS